MSKKVSFSRHLEKYWLDQTALWVSEGLDSQAINEKINTMLEPMFNCKVNLGKTRNLLCKFWSTSVNSEYDFFQHEAIHLVKAQCDIPLSLHWGQLIAKNSFFSDVVRFIGRNSKLNDSFTYAQVQKRIVELYGDTETVKRHLRSVLKTLVEFGVIDRRNGRSYSVVNHKLLISSNMKNWLLTAVLNGDGIKSRSLSDLLDDSVWFPFDFDVQFNEISDAWFELHQQGNELILFKK
jgi:hypothetical protein